MKKMLCLFLVMLMLPLAAVAETVELSPEDPQVLTLWHYYNGAQLQIFDQLVQTFNETVGMEKGIIIDVTMMSNAAQIGKKLLDAQNDVPGVPAMPDLFFCHNNNAEELGADNLVNWKDPRLRICSNKTVSSKRRWKRKRRKWVCLRSVRAQDFPKFSRICS